MRIDLTTFGVEPSDQGKTGRAGQAAGSVKDTTGSASTTTENISTAGVDQTSFSFDPARVQSLQARVLAQPEIREAKVRSLQQAIDKGDYSVPASQVASALVSELAGAHG
jgi:flagellar biosynthesis anti-sigma factor FlgM